MACTASYQEARASVTHVLNHRRYPSLEPGPGAAGGFFAAEDQGFFADFDAAVEEVEAAVVLGEAFAGDLNAFDLEFEFLVAMDEAREEREVRGGGVRR